MPQATAGEDRVVKTSPKLKKTKARTEAAQAALSRASASAGGLAAASNYKRLRTEPVPLVKSKKVAQTGWNDLK